MLDMIEVCAGIGGISLGFEATGAIQTVAFVERDDYATRVLKRHWPDVPLIREIRDASAWNLPPCDILAGGIPCQPHSLAGRRGASSDERDLWPEFHRLVCELRPRWAVVENVPGLRSSEDGRFFGRILADLARAGYDAEWVSLSAQDVGAPHLRERVWIVAYPQEQRQHTRGLPVRAQASDACARECREDVSDAESQRCGSGRTGRPNCSSAGQAEQPLCDTSGPRPPHGTDGAIRRATPQPQRSDWWAIEPDVGRVAPRISARVDRLRCLGNAVVPECGRVIGEHIVAHARRIGLLPAL